jgi:hypothetical protein
MPSNKPQSGGAVMFAEFFKSFFSSPGQTDDVTAQKFERFRSVRESRKAEMDLRASKQVKSNRLIDHWTGHIDQPRGFTFGQAYQPQSNERFETLLEPGKAEAYQSYRPHPSEVAKIARESTTGTLYDGSKFFRRKKSA